MAVTLEFRVFFILLWKNIYKCFFSLSDAGKNDFMYVKIKY